MFLLALSRHARFIEGRSEFIFLARIGSEAVCALSGSRVILKGFTIVAVLLLRGVVIQAYSRSISYASQRGLAESSRKS